MGLINTFYTDYDSTIIKVCKPYERFQLMGVQALPADLKEICDIGIGTGNFARAVRSRFPDVPCFGIDNNPSFLAQAEVKVKNLRSLQADAFTCQLPHCDFYISALTLHHLEPRMQKEKLRDIINHAGRGFVNFDLVLPESGDKEEIVDAVVSYALTRFPEELAEEVRRTAGREIIEKDNPLKLSQHKELFSGAGYRFDLLGYEFPFVVYKVIKL